METNFQIKDFDGKDGIDEKDVELRARNLDESDGTIDNSLTEEQLGQLKGEVNNTEGLKWKDEYADLASNFIHESMLGDSAFEFPNSREELAYIDPKDTSRKNQYAISVGLGANTAQSGAMTVTGADGSSHMLNPEWEGKGFEAPPYYEITGSLLDFFGEGTHLKLKFTHAKAYMVLDNEMFNDYQLTDGANILAAGIEVEGNKTLFDVTPYIGAYVGLAIPHVDGQTKKDSPVGEQIAYGYQVTGFAGQLSVGIRKDLPYDGWNAFIQYAKDIYQVEKSPIGDAHVSIDSLTLDELTFGVEKRF